MIFYLFNNHIYAINYVVYYHTKVIIMRAEDRISARRQLDKRLNSINNNTDLCARPPRGWLKAIREALGMTMAQLGKRLGVVQSRAFTIEQAEANGTITLNSLEKAAQAMDCRLVYALVPRKPLEDIIEERAWIKAKQRMSATRHTMALEAQGVDKEDEAEQLKRLARKLVEKAGSELWEEDE